MLIEICCFTSDGRRVAERIASDLREQGDAVTVFAPASLADGTNMRAMGSVDEWTCVAFDRADALVFVSATGIAVRAIAPYLTDKYTDPAVIVVDDQARHALSLLSGHVGGANALTHRIADIISADPVVTTATDGKGCFSVDTWAQEQGLRMIKSHLAKAVSAALLKGDTVGFLSDFAIEGELPKGLSTQGDHELGIHVTLNDRSRPFARTLHVIPPCVTLGIGCKRGVSADDVETSVKQALDAAQVSLAAVRTVSTIDVKRDEVGLVAWAKSCGLDMTFHSAKELEGVPGTFTSSDFVRKTVGVDNVADRAAVATGERLIQEKHTSCGVTCAVSMTEPNITFEGTPSARGSVSVIGLGPGAGKSMSIEAREALAQSEVVFGYETYLRLIETECLNKEVHSSPMGAELKRCEEAIEAALAGRRVALVCSGDAGIYGMASPLLECAEGKDVDIRVVAGVTAATAGAALVGAPLANDWCTISLSDYLTPFETIEKRLAAAAQAGFAIVLYNPASRSRPDHLRRAVEVLLRYLSPDTVCGIATDVGRPHEWSCVLTLQDLPRACCTMGSVVFIGTGRTRVVDGRMVEPRGYARKGGRS